MLAQHWAREFAVTGARLALVVLAAVAVVSIVVWMAQQSQRSAAIVSTLAKGCQASG